MKSKLSQILLVVFVGLIGVLSANAQNMNMDGFVYKNGNTLQQSGILKQGEGLKSKNGKYAAILQKDGNFCLYKLVEVGKSGEFIHCTLTVGDTDKQGSFLGMQNDGNLALYNSKKAHLWSTNTYQGSEPQKGRRLVMEDDGKLILYGRDNKTAIYDFQKGRLY